jgi:hypothetical protein
VIALVAYSCVPLRGRGGEQVFPDALSGGSSVGLSHMEARSEQTPRLLWASELFSVAVTRHSIPVRFPSFLLGMAVISSQVFIARVARK